LLALAFWISLLLAVMTAAAAIVKAALEASEEDAHKAETVSFARMTLTGIFGVTIGQGLVPLGFEWWVTAIISVVLMLALLFGTQLAARRFGHDRFGTWLSKKLRGVVNSLHLLFTPLSLPKEEAPEEFEQDLIDSVEEFGETIIREIMVPRVDMATIRDDSTLSAAMEFFLKSGFSRLPIVGKTVDEVTGILYLKDLARVLNEGDKKTAKRPVSEVCRKVVFMPESLPVDDLLQAMQSNATHIAIVIDEYGGVAGLVTMEDVIEELVGEIADEYDDDEDELTELEDGGYRVAARYSLMDLGELFEIELDDEDVDSVGGLLAKELGRLPMRGDVIVFSGLRFEADRIEGRRKRLVSVLVHRDQNLTDAQAAFGVDENEN
jgi:CBS domain containing-hemolysin-like protein